MSFITSPETDKLYPALIEAQANMPIILKESKAHHGKYASVEEIIRAAYPWLAKYKMCVKTATTWQDGMLFVSCRIMHESTQFIEGQIPVLLVPLEKDTIQCLGARISYLIRYMLRDMLGIHNAELDDDGDQSSINYNQTTTQKVYYINQEQIDQLENMMADRPEIKEKLLNFYKVTALAFIPASKFWDVHDGILKIKDRYKQANQA